MKAIELIGDLLDDMLPDQMIQANITIGAMPVAEIFIPDNGRQNLRADIDVEAIRQAQLTKAQ